MKKFIPLFIIGLIITSSLLFANNVSADYYNTPPSNAVFHPENPDYYDGNKRLTLKKRADIEMASAPNLHYDKYSNDYYWCNWIYNKNLDTWVCEKSAEKPTLDPVIQSKSYTSKNSAQAVSACPLGYQYSSVGGGCARVPLPTNSHVSSNGTGWECNAGYRLDDYHTGCVKGYSSSSASYIYNTASASETVENNVEHTTEYVDGVAVTKYIYYYDEDDNNSVLTTQKPTTLPSTGPAMGLMLIGSLVGGIGVICRKKQ